jgi:hypothetical protein
MQELDPQGPIRNRTSPKGFGLFMAAFFALVCGLPLISGRPMRTWALIPAVLFLVSALVRPQLLAPLNHAWFRLGILLNRIVSPLVLGAMYYLVLTPAALIFRLFQKDPLNLQKRPDLPTYWQARTPPGPASDSLQNQF